MAGWVARVHLRLAVAPTRIRLRSRTALRLVAASILSACGGSAVRGGFDAGGEARDAAGGASCDPTAAADAPAPSGGSMPADECQTRDDCPDPADDVCVQAELFNPCSGMSTVLPNRCSRDPCRGQPLSCSCVPLAFCACQGVDADAGVVRCGNGL
jgi:hypothetical protein